MVAPLLIVMCGLPGSGKSTLSRRLAQELQALRWDKDELRHLLFSPDAVDYDRPLNDLCMEMLYAAALRVFAREPSARPVVILDGRPYMELVQRQRVKEVAQQAHANLAFVLCTAPLDVLKARIIGDSHLAPDRDIALLERLSAAAQPFEGDEIAVDTGKLDLDQATAFCLQQLGARGLI